MASLQLPKMALLQLQGILCKEEAWILHAKLQIMALVKLQFSRLDHSLFSENYLPILTLALGLSLIVGSNSDIQMAKVLEV